MNTEKAIKKAALEVFLKTGYDGARMQEIADLAGVNKAMLYYYYSSKANLFEHVVTEVMMDMIPTLEAVITSDLPFIEKIKSFISVNFKKHQDNPEILPFVFSELSKNPDLMEAHVKTFEPFKKYIEYFQISYEEEVKAGRLKSFSLPNLVVIIQALTEYFHLSKFFLKPFLTTDKCCVDDQFENQLLDQILLFIESALQNK